MTSSNSQAHHHHHHHHHSIFRAPDVQHYSLLHRSQRDPAINEPELGDRILHPIQRQNESNRNRKKISKAQTRSELESTLGHEQVTKLRPNLGEATMYNVFFDDSEYDYMQHLRPIGSSNDAILIPSTSKKTNNTLDLPSSSFSLRSSTTTTTTDHDHHHPTILQLPDSVKPTPNDQMLSYSDHLQFATPSHSAIPQGGLLPSDDDPGLREVLDALEDEAFIEEGTNDDFFGQIVQGGERDPSEQPDWIAEEEGLPPSDHPHHPSRSQSDWESQFARFKPSITTTSDDDDDDRLEAASSTRLTRSKTHHNTRKTHPSTTSRHPSIAGSAFSMSSSAMFRNQGLTDLDDRFDQIEKEYNESSSDEEEDARSEDSTATETPRLIASGETIIRDDFESIMDEFLDRFEVIGGKMKRTLEGTTATEKMETLRNRLLTAGDDDNDDDDEEHGTEASERRMMKHKILLHLRREQQLSDSQDQQDQDPMMTILEPQEDRYAHKWDCQTILSTYSNLENHPRLIKIREAIGASDETRSKARKNKHQKQQQGLEGVEGGANDEPRLDRSTTTPMTGIAGKRIQIDRITGFPIVDGTLVRAHSLPQPGEEQEEEDYSGTERDELESLGTVRETIKRDRNEDKEAKKARKAQVKAEQAARRQLKKHVKHTFAIERNHQTRIDQKLADRRALDIAGVRGKGITSLS